MEIEELYERISSINERIDRNITNKKTLYDNIKTYNGYIANCQNELCNLELNNIELQKEVKSVEHLIKDISRNN